MTRPLFRVSNVDTYNSINGLNINPSVEAGATKKYDLQRGNPRPSMFCKRRILAIDYGVVRMGFKFRVQLFYKNRNFADFQYIQSVRINNSIDPTYVRASGVYGFNAMDNWILNEIR